ncbi:MAG: hypothetical protein KIT16_18630 [Rhodospirillaceae bacterium]|nr:hypothetical protein [Rhodospirillaceae bacterium]
MTIRRCPVPTAAASRRCDMVAPPLYTRALVMFGSRTDVPWLRWLRAGFRHCFVALDDGTEWLTVDPLLHRLEVRATGLSNGFDLAAEYRRRGLTVVEYRPLPVPVRRAPLGVFTCVETVKRLLGIRERHIVTPWQLYRWLTHGLDRRSRSAMLLPGDNEKNKSRK